MQENRVRATAVALALAFVGSALTSPSIAAQSEKDFGKALAAVRKDAAKGRWSKASTKLDEALQENANQAYVVKLYDEVLELRRRCAFHEKHPTPDPSTLISGTVEKYKKSTGDILLTYTPSQTEDFDDGRGLLWHPLRFKGPHSIYVELPGPTQVSVYVDVDDPLKGSMGLLFGDQFGSQIMRYEREQWVPADMNAAVHRPKRGETLEVRVSKRSAQLRAAGRKLIEGKRLRKNYGQWGISSDGWTKLTIKGKAEPSWLQNVLDQHMLKLEEEFDEEFEAKDSLPSWLVTAAEKVASEKPEEEEEANLFDFMGFPMPLNPSTTTEIEWFSEKFLRKLYEREHKKAIQIVEAADEKQLNELNRAWLRGWLRMQIGDAQGAIPELQKVIDQKPEFELANGWLMGAMRDLGQWDDAIEYLEAQIEKQPKLGYLYKSLYELLRVVDRLEDADQVIELADKRGARGKAIDELRATMRAAAEGPVWPVRYSDESKQYIVYSDIDEDVCEDATKILEEAYLMYDRDMGDPGDAEEKFVVYIFGGQGSYSRYASNTIGSDGAHTAGMYQGVMKQLLIWNLPRRDDLYRTVRHEGFHQYLDRVCDGAPVWMNEGTAEYYERAKRESGRIRGGQWRPSHARTLREFDLIPLEEFVFWNNQRFRQGDQMAHYAQSWALVHFLRETTSANKKIYQRLYEALQDNKPMQEAVRIALDKTDMKALDSAFRDYVRDVILKRG